MDEPRQRATETARAGHYRKKRPLSDSKFDKVTAGIQLVDDEKWAVLEELATFRRDIEGEREKRALKKRGAPRKPARESFELVIRWLAGRKSWNELEEELEAEQDELALAALKQGKKHRRRPNPVRRAQEWFRERFEYDFQSWSALWVFFLGMLMTDEARMRWFVAMSRWNPGFNKKWRSTSVFWEQTFRVTRVITVHFWAPLEVSAGLVRVAKDWKSDGLLDDELSNADQMAFWGLANVQSFVAWSSASSPEVRRNEAKWRYLQARSELQALDPDFLAGEFLDSIVSLTPHLEANGDSLDAFAKRMTRAFDRLNRERGRNPEPPLTGRIKLTDFVRRFAVGMPTKRVLREADSPGNQNPTAKKTSSRRKKRS